MATAFARKVTTIPGSSWASMIAAVPVMVWVHDSFYSLVRVRGSSMEPTLRNGDIVVMRKSDGFWHRQKGNEKDNADHIAKQVERERIQDFERDHCSQAAPSWLIHKPPTPVTGNLVVYKDPSQYPSQCNIKRVIGLGGQVVMMPSSRFHKENAEIPSYRMNGKDRSMRLATPSVPPYSLWVEGDNYGNSQDSKNHGPVTKKLLVGIAEYRIWPPTRIGSLMDSVVDEPNEPRSYSYWP